MKRIIFTGALSVALIALVSMLTVPSPRKAIAADPVTLEVLDPSGGYEVTALHAPRIDTLAGKTICELSNGSWEDGRTFPAIRDVLQRKYPDLKIIPFKEFPVGSLEIDSEDAVKLVKQKGCQAVIVGNAG